MHKLSIGHIEAARPKGSCRSSKMCIKILLVLVIACVISVLMTGCSAFKFEQPHKIFDNSSTSKNYTASYDFHYQEILVHHALNADMTKYNDNDKYYNKYNKLFKEALSKTGMFASVQHSKFGQEDVNFTFNIVVDSESNTMPFLSFMLGGMIPVPYVHSTITTQVSVKSKKASKNFTLVDNRTIWWSIPSGLIGIFNPAEKKFVSSVVDRSLSLLDLKVFYEGIEERLIVKEESIARETLSNLTKIMPKARKKNDNAIAVVIGNKKYNNTGVPEVSFALNDAQMMMQYLVNSMGYQQKNIIVIENATFLDMRLTFGDERNSQGKLSSYVNPGVSDVFVYYSGHGAPNSQDNSPYLVPVDGDPDRIALSGYPVDLLYENLAKLKAKSVSVVLDACFSGTAGDGEMLLKNASPVAIEVRNPVNKLDNGVVITASSGNQVASWYKEAGHGLLTYFYLSGLSGDADQNRDGRITVGEMRTYLQDRQDGVPYIAGRLYGREQVPQVWGNDEAVIFQK
ncbi:MAG TPA: caspase family protein [Candidatus Syntrophosphaera sp.]|nr:caspase family protein [Candidatus Syntrophosphaera sp.]